MINTVIQAPLARRGLLFILSSPSGAGKSTIARMLLEQDKHIALSVSVTTRPPRPGEIDGKDYHFIDEAEFHRLVEDNASLHEELGLVRNQLRNVTALLRQVRDGKLAPGEIALPDDGAG